MALPTLILAAINAKNLWDEHWEHWDHLPPLEDRIEYDYMNIRTKKFFWGDGDKASWDPFALPQFTIQSIHVQLSTNPVLLPTDTLVSIDIPSFPWK